MTLLRIYHERYVALPRLLPRGFPKAQLLTYPKLVQAGAADVTLEGLHAADAAQPTGEAV